MRWLITICFTAHAILAWENHALQTAIAVSNFKEITQQADVQPESLEAFLKTTQKQLAPVLQQEEVWARKNVPGYPSRPNSLEFIAQRWIPGQARDDTDRRHSALDAESIIKKFLNAIRVNPTISTKLYLQVLPNQAAESKSYLEAKQVSLIPHSLPATVRFVSITPEKKVSPKDIFISAVDEPDYGMDLHLWSDSLSSWGQSYGFGSLPFGNPELEFATQAPFHMGLFHESPFLYKIAPEIGRTFPEYRIHQFYTLSRFAFATGHPYWGWRFAGWGAHYIQDLTQPYHASLLPKSSWLKPVFYGLLDKIGIHGPKQRLVKQISDEHLHLEQRVYQEMLKFLAGDSSKLAMALQVENRSPLQYQPKYIRESLSLESHQTKPQAFETLMQNFAKHTRAWVHAILSQNRA